MSELINLSFLFFVMVVGLSSLLHVVRTSPILFSHVDLSKRTYKEWVADQLLTSFGIERESFLARFMKLVAIIAKYGIAAWSFTHISDLSLIFWILVWVTLLVLEVMRKSAQFYIPAKWENVSLKLDSEHFWLLNLILLGVVELHLIGREPYGLGSLVVFYVIFSGETKNTILASFEDVVSTILGVVAFLYLFKVEVSAVEHLMIYLCVAIALKSFVRLFLGRTWVKRKFWWIAQFCLMTSLLIKSMEVLNVWALLNS